MYSLFTTIGTLAGLCFFITLVWLIVKAVRKKGGKKLMAIICGVSFVLYGGGLELAKLTEEGKKIELEKAEKARLAQQQAIDAQKVQEGQPSKTQGKATVRYNPVTGKSEITYESTAPQTGVVEVTEDFSNAQKYLKQIADVIKNVGQYVSACGKLLSSKPLGTWSLEDVAEFAANSAMITNSYDQVKTLKAPLRYKEIHDAMLKGLKFYVNMMTLSAVGIDNRDADKIDQANKAFDQGNQYILQATNMVQIASNLLKTELEYEPAYAQILKKHTEPELKKIWFNLRKCADELTEMDRLDDYDSKCKNPIRAKTKLSEDEFRQLGEIAVLKKWPQPPPPDDSKMLKRVLGK